MATPRPGRAHGRGVGRRHPRADRPRALPRQPLLAGCRACALARAAAARGADVTLVAANVSLPDPAGVKVVRVETTEELRDAVVSAAVSADAVVMAAAPADFRPLPTSDGQDQEVGRRRARRSS